MSVRHTGSRHRVLTTAGVVTAAAGSVAGSLRMVPGDRRMMHGMPLSAMPEMFVAGAGILLALTGALLRGTPRPTVPVRQRGRTVVSVVATAALTIDISKTSTLGFVIPGMRTEYSLGPSPASMLAVAGLTGTATGALLVGRLADRVGRRMSYVVATLGFTATSMCAGMPTFLGTSCASSWASRSVGWHRC